MGTTPQNESSALASRMERNSFFGKLAGWARKVRWDDLLIVLVGTLLALIIRYSLRLYVSEDYQHFTSFWYAALQEQGWGAFKSGVSDYTPAYLYVLFLTQRILPAVSALTAIKIPSILFDLLCAWFVYRIVKAKYDGIFPVMAYFAVLFSPTVILNSSAWGQADVIYTTALVACLFFLLKGKGWPACIAFGIAFAFKLQAIFLAPLLFVLLLKKRVTIWQLLTIPAAYMVMILPAWIAGRPLSELLLVYLSQTDTHVYLSMSAPNLYTWLSEGFLADDMILQAGILFGAAICLLYVLLGYKSKAKLTPELIVQLALLSALIVPFFLPRMHERYFYPADILSILLAFYLPRYWYIPVVVNMVSFFVYVPYLFNGYQPIPQQILALFLLGVIALLTRDLIKALHAPTTPIPAQ